MTNVVYARFTDYPELARYFVDACLAGRLDLALAKVEGLCDESVGTLRAYIRCERDMRTLAATQDNYPAD
jgi:hypothetical protein